MFRRPIASLLCLASVSLTSCSRASSASDSAPSPAPTPEERAANANAEVRPKVACPALLTSHSGPSTATVSAPPIAGSWGKVPEELRQLPPGAELCGSITLMGQAVISSSLSGKDLEAFYAPLFAKIGCEALQCAEARSGALQQTRCKCDKELYLHGTVNTDPSSASYLVGVRDMREDR